MIPIRNQQMFKIFDNQKFLVKFFRPKIFLGIKIFKQLLIPVPKCIELNS